MGPAGPHVSVLGRGAEWSAFASQAPQGERVPQPAAPSYAQSTTSSAPGVQVKVARAPAPPKSEAQWGAEDMLARVLDEAAAPTLAALPSSIADLNDGMPSALRQVWRGALPSSNSQRARPLGVCFFGRGGASRASLRPSLTKPQPMNKLHSWISPWTPREDQPRKRKTTLLYQPSACA